MKTMFLIALTLIASSAGAQTYVQPHVNRDGTVTQGHYRSEPNSSRYDNYGAKDNMYGNTNPYTGQQGSQRSEWSNPPAYNGQQNSSSNSYGNPYGNNRRSK